MGLFTRFQPKFVRRYADLSAIASDAFRRFKSDVESGKFPAEEEGYK
ncbi:MAG: 3-methyl-2-oxobutanoate hydroxymethyltransferase [Nitrospiria bacterium]